MIAAVFALVLCGDAILMQKTEKTTMGHGQHKKTKRARSFKAGNITRYDKAVKAMTVMDGLTEMMSDADINLAAHMANEEVLSRIASLLAKSNVSTALKQEVNHLLGLRTEANNTLSNVLSQEQVGWLMQHGYIDEHNRFSERMMNPMQTALYHFWLNVKPENSDVVGMKYESLSVFCSFFSIASCPFSPAESLEGMNERIKTLQYGSKQAEGKGGSLIQTPEFENSLLKLLRFNQKFVKN